MDNEEQSQYTMVAPASRVTRRKLLKTAGLTSVGAMLATSGVGYARASTGAFGYEASGQAGQVSVTNAADSSDTIPFYGEHQAGIATPVQAQLCFAAFDVISGNRTELRDLLRT